MDASCDASRDASCDASRDPSRDASCDASRDEPAPRHALDLLRWQFDLTWALFTYHLERIEPDDFLWEPVANCWTMRPAGDGTWVPDWAESEPDPVPLPTAGWLSWHIGWWWSTALAHVRGHTPPERTGVVWPGAGGPTVAWLNGLRVDWLEALDRLTDADLASAAPFPWGNDPGTPSRTWSPG